MRQFLVVEASNQETASRAEDDHCDQVDLQCNHTVEGRMHQAD